MAKKAFRFCLKVSKTKHEIILVIISYVRLYKIKALWNQNWICVWL